MASKLTKILEILEDGKWHETDKLWQTMDLNNCDVKEITDFLGKYGFVEVDNNGKRIRTNKDFREMVAQSTDSKK